jgi:hypothetical protein
MIAFCVSGDVICAKLEGRVETREGLVDGGLIDG